MDATNPGPTLARGDVLGILADKYIKTQKRQLAIQALADHCFLPLSLSTRCLYCTYNNLELGK